MAEKRDCFVSSTVGTVHSEKVTYLAAFLFLIGCTIPSDC
jgi:hypothetical protein